MLHCSANKDEIWRFRRSLCSVQKREGNEGLPSIAGLGEEIFFEFVGRVHFAGGDLVIGSSDETEFAAGEPIAFGDADGRAEDAAGHWTPSVDVAETGFGVEGGTGRIVGEVFEAGLIFFFCAEVAGDGVAGEIGGVLVEPGLRAGGGMRPVPDWSC